MSALGARLTVDRQGAIGEIYVALGSTCVATCKALSVTMTRTMSSSESSTRSGDTIVATTLPEACRRGSSASPASEPSTTCAAGAPSQSRWTTWLMVLARTAASWPSAMFAALRFATRSSACPMSSARSWCWHTRRLHPVRDRYPPGRSPWNREGPVIPGPGPPHRVPQPYQVDDRGNAPRCQLLAAQAAERWRWRSCNRRACRVLARNLPETALHVTARCPTTQPLAAPYTCSVGRVGEAAAWRREPPEHQWHARGQGFKSPQLHHHNTAGHSLAAHSAPLLAATRLPDSCHPRATRC